MRMKILHQQWIILLSLRAFLAAACRSSHQIDRKSGELDEQGSIKNARVGLVVENEIAGKG